MTETILDNINAHAGKVTKIIVSPDYRYVFSTGSDGTLFIFKLEEYSETGIKTTSLGLDDDKPEDNQSSIVDEALADIVLVRRTEMEEWHAKQMKLKRELIEA